LAITGVVTAKSSPNPSTTPDQRRRPVLASKAWSRFGAPTKMVVRPTAGVDSYGEEAPPCHTQSGRQTSAGRQPAAAYASTLPRSVVTNTRPPLTDAEPTGSPRPPP
jgi:hypothetical protein